VRNVTRRMMQRRRVRPPATGGEEPRGPIVVGGVGGSGTRVVEEIMRQLNIYTGSDLNVAGDNRWFTSLCKLPRWDMEAPAPKSPVFRALATLEMAMTGRLEFTARDRRIVDEALRRNRHWWRYDRLIDDRPPAWLRARVTSLLRSAEDYALGSPMWGWKEPNSHFFIRHLHAHFGDRLRYVHVIRNGLDMAQSRNQLQVRRWGSRFGVRNGSLTPDPAASLDFWIRANEAAIEAGKALPQGTFFLVSYDDICANPREEVTRFVRFLDLDPPESVLRELVAIPQSGTTRPRAEVDLETVFGHDRLTRVRALGYAVER
jgi:Sulfotransferase family